MFDDPACAPLFSGHGRAEVQIAGRVMLGGGPRVISGKIDRMAVDGETVRIVDFKTGSVPSARAPDAHVVQLALYRLLVASIYPRHLVEASLIYTAAPRLVRLDPAEMDAALRGLNISAHSY